MSPRVGANNGAGRSATAASPACFADGGETGALLCGLAWSANPLGPVEQWPTSLRTAVDLCLSARCPLALWWGPDLVLLYNDAFRPFVGDRHPAALGRPGRDVLADAGTALGPLLMRVLETGKVVEEAGCPLSLAPVRDEAGGVGGVLGSVAPAPTSSGASAERYRLFYQHARDIALFVRRDGRIVEANDAAVAAYGYTRAELLARTVYDLRAAPDVPLVAAQIAQADGGGVTFETTHRRKDGGAFPVEVGSRGADVAGERLLLSIVRDVTDRRRTDAELREREALFRDLFENANDVIYTLDLEGRVTSANKRAEAVFGYTREEFTGRNSADIVAPEYMPRMHEALRRKLEGDPGPTTYELEIIRKDGRRVPLEVSSRLIVRDGRPVGIQGIARDVTERKRAEAVLRDAGRRKDEFLAMLAHELRNPLAPIRNAVQVLRLAGPARPALRRAQEVIQRQTAHLARLVDDLLDVSRISRGRVPLRAERLDLAALVRNAAEDHRLTLESAGLRLEVGAPDGPLWTVGDPTRLAQVVGNLLHNAGKFTDAGGLVAASLAADPDGKRAVLAVRDTGVGMDADMLTHLFEPFSQADRSLDRSRGGLGLGLALVKGLVELHGGAVHAQSPGPGGGAEFTVVLPLGDGPAMPEEVLPPPDERKSLRVLIVEDNRDAAESLRLVLEMAGHEATAVYAGLAGLEAARRLRPDVVLCDIGLPGGMDGYAVVRALRAQPEQAGAVLIALTGYAQEEDKDKARQAGFDHHLTKPMEPSVLLRLLATLPARTDADSRTPEIP